MEEERKSEHRQPKFSWQRLAVFAALFTAFTGAGFYAVFDQFSGRNFSLDGRLLQPEVILASLVLLLIYFAADGLRLYYTLIALGARFSAKAMAKLVFINIFFPTSPQWAPAAVLRRSGLCTIMAFR